MAGYGVTDWEETPESTKPYPDKHLALPILVTLLDRFADVTSRGLARYRAEGILGRMYPQNISRCVRDACESDANLLYGGLLDRASLYLEVVAKAGGKLPRILNAKDYPRMLTARFAVDDDLADDIRIGQSVAEKEIDAYCDWISDIVKPSLLKDYRSKLKADICLSDDTKYWYKVATFWSFMCDQSRKRFDQPINRCSYKIGTITYSFWKGYFTREAPGEETQVGMFEQLQMLQDAARSRFNVHLAIDFGMHHGSDQIRYHFRNQLQWQEQCLLAYGNEGYAFAKYPEAIYKARLTLLSGGDILPRSSYLRTFDKIAAKEAGMDSTTPMTNALRANADRVTTLGDCAELFGLCKLSGHPSVYADYSGRAVQKAATTRDRSLPRSILNLQRSFRHLFISGYIDKHASWPPFVRQPLPGTRLHRHWINNATALPSSSYDPSDLDCLWFGKLKTLNFDFHEDYLQFLDDKALSVGVDRCATFWYGNGVESARGTDTRERRLLLQFLNTKKIDTVELVNRLRLGKFKPHEMIVELTQKEREFKIAARCFAKMCLEVRLYWVILESNTANFMEHYFPQQTMTMSEAAQKKRLYDMIKNWDAPDRAQLEVDFATWNNRWNKWTCDPIARDMEALFGMPGAWSQVHDFFTNATIVVTDKNMIPPGADPKKHVDQWPVSDVLWRGTHIGGLEGIQQKFWTVCTIAMMYYALHDQPVSFIMAGQGDNHVFTLYFNTATFSMKDTLVKMLAVMELRCATLNHDVKPEECLDSSTVLTYSKELYVRGVQQQYCLKFASRAFWLDDKSTPSLSKEISGVMACAQMCADTAPNQIQAVTWKHLLLRLMLRERAVAPGSRGESERISALLSNNDYYEFFALLPGSLGGMPTCPWTRFFMKGEVDDLSWDVAATLRTSVYAASLGGDLKRLIRGKYRPSRIDVTQLISDPHSIPVDRPTDRTELIKRSVQRSRYLTNPANIHVASIMETCVQDCKLKDALSLTRPFFPDIMSDLYSWSPSGLRESILGRFNKTRTLADMTRGQFTTEINAANCQQLDFIKRRFSKQAGVFRPELTPFEVCQKLREQWGCDLKNADIGSYTPFEFKLTQDLGNNNSIMIGVDKDGPRCTTSLGRQPPNFGTKTRAKTSEHGYRIYSSGSAVQDLKGIVLTASELGSSAAMLDLCDLLTLQRSPWTARSLSSVLPTAFGGCASHRHTRLSQAHFSILGSKTVPTHLSLCSDRAGQLSGGLYDYPVAFQAFYLTGTALVQQLAPIGLIRGDEWFGFEVPTRMEPISDTDVIAPQLTMPAVNLSGNPLAYTDKLLSTSVPDSPDPSLIPHLRNPETDQRSLIYSAMLDWMLANRRALEIVDTVSRPVDIMDLKEFLCCTPTVLLEATAAAICATGFSRCATKKKPDMIRAEAAIMKICDSMGGYIARLFMHPMASSSQMARLVGAVSPAGRGGGVVAAHRVGDYLRRQCSKAIIFKTWRQGLKLMLFGDHTTENTSRSFAHGLLMVAMQATTGMSYRLTDNQIQLLKRITGHMSGDTAASTPIRVRDCVAWMARTRDNTYRASYPGLVTLRYITVPAQQALRSLRMRKIRIRPSGINKLRQLTLVPRSGSYRIDKNLSGSCQRTCLCGDERDHILRADLILQSSRRQVGAYAAITADWHAIVRSSGLCVNTPTLCIGVGHGGSARAALSYMTCDVEGMDLRDSFPNVPQREGSFIPPEVLVSGMSSRFKWHKHVWRRGGNVYTWKGSKNQRTIILDIDSDFVKTRKALGRCRGPGTIVVRTRACTHELETLIDALQPTHIWKLTVRGDIVRPSVVLVADREMINLESASGYRVEITSLPTLDYRCGGVRPSEITTYIGYLLHISYSQLGTTQNDLANEATRLRVEAATPGVEPLIARRLANAADTLRDVILASGKAFIDISYDMRHLQKNALRIAGRLNVDIFRDKSLPIHSF